MKKAKAKSKKTAAELISKYIAEITDWRGKALAKIRKAFLEADEAMIEEWKWRGSPVWEHHGIIAVANAHKGKVKVTFYQGAHLQDPDKLFNAGLDGNKWRAIDFGENDKINESALKKLIKSAVSYNVSRHM